MSHEDSGHKWLNNFGALQSGGDGFLDDNVGGSCEVTLHLYDLEDLDLNLEDVGLQLRGDVDLLRLVKDNPRGDHPPLGIVHDLLL